MATPVWAHKKRYCRFEDPINVEFRSTKLTDIVSELVSTNWKKPGFLAADLFLHGANGCGQPQDDQLVDGNLLRRFHVRLWTIEDGTIVAGAHEERLSGIGHEVISFEAGKEQIADAFRNGVRWRVDRDILDLRNLTDHPHHNGSASVIEFIQR